MIKKQSSLHNILLILIFVLIASTTVNSQFLRTSGKEIIDKNDNPIILRGLGLGGWMLQEPYMMKVSGGAAKSSLLQFIADITGKNIHLTRLKDKTAYGVLKILIDQLFLIF